VGSYQVRPLLVEFFPLFPVHRKRAFQHYPFPDMPPSIPFLSSINLPYFRVIVISLIDFLSTMIPPMPPEKASERHLYAHALSVPRASPVPRFYSFFFGPGIYVPLPLAITISAQLEMRMDTRCAGTVSFNAKSMHPRQDDPFFPPRLE